MEEECQITVVLTNGKIRIGAGRFPDTKKIALCVADENTLVVCGYFTNLEKAEYFMDKLAECVGAEMEQESEQ